MIFQHILYCSTPIKQSLRRLASWGVAFSNLAWYICFVLIYLLCHQRVFSVRQFLVQT